MLELFKLIYAYSKNGKLVDKEFIEKLVELEIKTKKLNSYIQDVKFFSKFDDENKKSLASYRNGILNFYMPKIYEMLENRDKYLDLFVDIEKLFYCNTCVTQIVKHEIEHANQTKKEEFVKTIEGDILRLSYGIRTDLKFSFDFFQKCLMSPKWIQIFHDINYSYSPHERFAEIHSNREMISILSYISKDIPNLLEFFKTKELESMILGYVDKDGKLVSPTLKYLQGMGMDKYLLECSWYNEEEFASLNDAYKNRFDLFERLNYGFPIEKEEYDVTLQALIRSRFF